MGEVQYLQLAHIYSKLSDFGGPAASVAIEDHTQGEAPQASFRQPHPQPNHQESSDNDKPDTEIEFTRIHKPPEKKLHHLTRHWLAPGEKGALSMSRLGASSSKEAEHMIRSMGQRELRDGFKKVYGSDTSSYNNNWLRRKLYEGAFTSLMNLVSSSSFFFFYKLPLLIEDKGILIVNTSSNRNEWQLKQAGPPQVE